MARRLRVLDICRLRTDQYHDFPKGTLVMLIESSRGSVRDFAVRTIEAKPRFLAWVWERDLAYVTSVSSLVDPGGLA